jgi:hypothetical protein
MNKLAIIVMVLVAGLVLWLFKPTPQPVDSWHPAEPDKRLSDVPRVDITPPKVPVYTAPAKRKLKLPDEIKDDPNKYVLTSARLPKDTHPQTVTTVIDAQTGEVQTLYRSEPHPWLAVEQTGELRVDYGIKSWSGLRVVRLSLREDVLQIKSFHAGINASIDSDGAWFVGVGVGWKW